MLLFCKCCFCYQFFYLFISRVTFSKSGVHPLFLINVDKAFVSFGKHAPSNGLPAMVPYFPIRLSNDTPKLTALSSIPNSLHSIPISLKKDIFNDKKQL